MHRLARRRIRETGVAVDQHIIGSEALPFADSSFDCVVSTFTLCSIAGVGEAVREIYRVLRPGGRLVFLEHGLSPDLAVRRWQRRLNWLEMRLGGGCQLDRPMRELIAGQPFAALQVRESYLAGVPRTHGYLYRGTAEK